MKVLNATPWEIEGGYDGHKFKFAPDQEQEIWDVNVVTHLCRSLSHKGLVHLNYGKAQELKYKSEEAFKQNQTLESLSLCRRWKEEALRNEKQAMRDLSKSNGTEFDKTSMRPKHFEAEIKKVDDKVEELKSKWKEKDGSSDDKNESAGEVRRNKRKVLV